MEEIKGPVVKEFVVLAGNFCSAVEKASGVRAVDLAINLQQSLPAIYAKATELPKPKYCYEEEPKDFVHEKDFDRLKDDLAQKMKVITGSVGTSQFDLSLNLMDIYKELKNFSCLYEVGISQAVNDAVWICRTNFEESFGITIIECLQNLHELIYGAKRGLQPPRIIEEDEGDEPWFSDDQEEIYNEDE